MSSAIVNKPVCGGRGRGRGWVGNFKPKPCNLRKEDIVSLPQSYANADKDNEINHIVSQKTCFITQSSVEDLSEKIARGILATQDAEIIKKEIICIDLISDSSESSSVSSNDTSNSESWIESVDNLELEETGTSIPTDEKCAINQICNDEKYNIETANVHVNATEAPNTKKKEIESNEKLNAVVNEKYNTTTNIKHDLDEKPKDLCDSFHRLSVSHTDNSIQDEVSSSNKISSNIEASEHDHVLLQAIHAKEFVPTWYIPEDEKNVVEYHEEQPFQHIDEIQIVLGVLNDVILSLMEDPGDFDNCIEHLTEHLLNFVTQEETLKQVVDTIIGQAINEQNFGFIAGKLSQHLDEKKTLELGNGVTFRKVFFKRCQDEFYSCMELCKDATSCVENKDKIYRTCILFGELLCTMKIKGTVNRLYKDQIVSKFVRKFLDIGIEENIVTLTKLLKLVGPELDKGRPKDVEALFDEVKEFYLDGGRSGSLPQKVRKELWDVYKLHSRDWDRSTSPISSPVPHVGDAEFFALPEHPVNTRRKSVESGRSCASPVDWEEFYGGDDADLYKYYMDMSDTEVEECEAYEEFLRMSGQLDS